MDEKYYGGFNTWGIAIFLIILFAAFLGNRGGWNNNGAAPAYGCNAVSNCQVEKQGIIDSARTQYLIETTARQTQEQTMTSLHSEQRLTFMSIKTCVINLLRNVRKMSFWKTAYTVMLNSTL